MMPQHYLLTLLLVAACCFEECRGRRVRQATTTTLDDTPAFTHEPDGFALVSCSEGFPPNRSVAFVTQNQIHGDAAVSCSLWCRQHRWFTLLQRQRHEIPVCACHRHEAAEGEVELLHRARQTRGNAPCPSAGWWLYRSTTPSPRRAAAFEVTTAAAAASRAQTANNNGTGYDDPADGSGPAGDAAPAHSSLDINTSHDHYRYGEEHHQGPGGAKGDPTQGNQQRYLAACRAPDQQLPPGEPFVVTFVTEVFPGTTFLVLSAAANRIRLHIYGLDPERRRPTYSSGPTSTPYPRKQPFWLMRQLCFQRVFQGLHPSALVLYVDGEAVILNRPITAALRAYQTIGAEVVFGADRASSPYKYLNAGVWMAPAATAGELSHVADLVRFGSTDERALGLLYELWRGEGFDHNASLVLNLTPTEQSAGRSRRLCALPPSGDFLSSNPQLSGVLCEEASEDEDGDSGGAPTTRSSRERRRRCPFAVHLGPGPSKRFMYARTLPLMWWWGEWLPNLADAEVWVGGERRRVRDVLPGPLLSLVTDKDTARAVRSATRLGVVGSAPPTP